MSLNFYSVINCLTIRIVYALHSLGILGIFLFRILSFLVSSHHAFDAHFCIRIRQLVLMDFLILVFLPVRGILGIELNCLIQYSLTIAFLEFSTFPSRFFFSKLSIFRLLTCYWNNSKGDFQIFYSFYPLLLYFSFYCFRIHILYANWWTCWRWYGGNRSTRNGREFD